MGNLRPNFENFSATEKRYFAQFKNFQKSGKSLKEYIKDLDRKQLSKFRNSLKLLKLKDIDKYLAILDQHTETAKKYKKKKEDQLKVKNLEIKINKLKSTKLKLGYRLQEISGLRVAEMANLESKDILIDKKGNIKIQVLNGKYGKDRLVNCFYDEWVLKKLLSIKSNKKGKLFCSKKYIMENANKLGFHTHELRKIYAHTFLYNCVEDKQTTLELLAQNMGHGNIKETYVYINRDINTNNSKIGKVKPFSKNDLT